MARLIDAKQLEKQIKEAFEDNNPVLMGLMLRWVRKQTTIDAVSVVRCKDCKHRGDAEECPMRYFETDRSYDGDGHMMLDYFDHDYTKDDGFCDRGERKSDG